VYAIIYTEMNVFVTGNDNLLNTVKRMMCGRVGFELLRRWMLYKEI